MDIIRTKITRQDIADKYLTYFKTASKAVVDITRGIMAVDADLHADLEAALLADGSKQEDLWGINLYPLKDRKDFIEYTSLINIRPHQGNKSMVVQDKNMCERIKAIVDKLVEYGA
jgi:hypothetical protein